MALLRATAEIAGQTGLQPVAAHFDHSLRPESRDDAAWVAREAEKSGLKVICGQGDVPSFAAEKRIGIEEAARRLRYEFLVQTAGQFGASFVATAHTADDQSETILFHILRGTGLRGLQGIPPRRRLSEGLTLVRPLLGVSRAEIEDYLDSLGQEFLHDATNTDRSRTRNRLRHDLLPLLRETVNPRVDEALRRLGAQAAEQAALLRRQARKELGQALIESTPAVIRFRCQRLKTRPRPVIRETIALAWRRAGWPRQAMSSSHWNRIADLVTGSGRQTLPGGTDARSRQGELTLRRSNG